MSFENLQETGVSGVKVEVGFVGFTFDLKLICNSEDIKKMSKEEFEEKLGKYIERLGKPKANINLERP